jgi:hypothetical protein
MANNDEMTEILRGPKPSEGMLTSSPPSYTISMDIPLFIRLLEYAHEDTPEGPEGDVLLHKIAERAANLGSKGSLSMRDYEELTEVSDDTEEESEEGEATQP